MYNFLTLPSEKVFFPTEMGTHYGKACMVMSHFRPRWSSSWDNATLKTEGQNFLGTLIGRFVSHLFRFFCLNFTCIMARFFVCPVVKIQPKKGLILTPTKRSVLKMVLRDDFKRDNNVVLQFYEGRNDFWKKRDCSTWTQCGQKHSYNSKWLFQLRNEMVEKSLKISENSRIFSENVKKKVSPGLN